MLPVFNFFIFIATWAWPNSVENTESCFMDNSKQDRCKYKKNNQRFTAKFVVLHCTYCKLWRDFGFFCSVNHFIKCGNKQNGLKSTNHKSQTMTFWTHVSKHVFLKRSAKMFHGTGKTQNMLNAQRSPTYFTIKTIDEQKEVTNTGMIDI